MKCVKTIESQILGVLLAWLMSPDSNDTRARTSKSYAALGERALGIVRAGRDSASFWLINSRDVSLCPNQFGSYSSKTISLESSLTYKQTQSHAKQNDIHQANTRCGSLYVRATYIFQTLFPPWWQKKTNAKQKQKKHSESTGILHYFIHCIAEIVFDSKMLYASDKWTPITQHTTHEKV